MGMSIYDRGIIFTKESKKCYKVTYYMCSMLMYFEYKH